MIELVRHLLQEQGCIAVPVDSLATTANLYSVGLTPFAAIGIMLALERQYRVEVPAEMLKSRSFADIESIISCFSRAPAARTTGAVECSIRQYPEDAAFL
jgi:acyl carrier protein